MIKPRLLILPDIHGRRFHCKALKEAVDNCIDIICLGDYLDPYWGDELHENGVFAPLQELVQIKKDNPEHVHLLIGNHDSSYIFDKEMCQCRYDSKNGPTYRNFFRENGDLFELASIMEIAGKRFLFSHAGITKRWLASTKDYFGQDTDSPEKIIKMLNDGYMDFIKDPTKDTVWTPLAYIGRSRGGWHWSGSSIWADVCEHMQPDASPWGDDVIQIFGHTQQDMHPARIDERAYCLDCRQPFYIDEDGVLMSYYNDKPIEAINLLTLWGRRPQG